MSSIFIPKEVAEKIKEAAQLEDVILDHVVNLNKKGTNRVGDCPSCGSSKFNYTPSKDLYKCWGCDKGGKTAVKFLMEIKGRTYQEALIELADRYNIAIEEQKQAPVNINHNESFRNRQLIASGIPDGEQKYSFTEGNNTYEYDRYQSATIDQYWNIVPEGDDMILHYLDLNGQPKMFQGKSGKPRRIIRVRWQNPEHHKNKDGSTGKYKSPAGSGSHLWYPQAFLTWYKQKKEIDTLYIPEGEKKADALCLAGIPAVGLMGIHNFDIKGDMATELRLIIKRCNIKNVVFLLDSDWEDLSIKTGKSVNQRPYNFFRAVQKYKNYFYAYNNEGIHLGIYFGHGKSRVYKGVDDLLVREQDTSAIKEEFTSLLIDRTGEGEYLNIHNITEMSEYKLKELFCLHSSQAFLDKHEDQLKQLPVFELNRVRRKWNEEEGKFEVLNGIQPEQEFWSVTYDSKERKRISFRYEPAMRWLRSKGYGVMKVRDNDYRLIHENCTVVTEVTPHLIRTDTRNFLQEINRYDVKEMMLRADEQYFSETKLMKMYPRSPKFIAADRNTQYLFFKNCYWKITAESIEQHKLDDLPGYIWQNQIIDFEPKKLPPMLKINREEDYWDIEETKNFQESDIAQFYARTSNFHWRKDEELGLNTKGEKVYVDREHPEKVTRKDGIKQTDNLMSKILAAGYLLHQYRDYGLMKAIVPMDGIESEVGQSNGGTGKSLWSKQFSYIAPQVVIDGKKKNIEEDNFIYSKVDERTQVILYDDVRVNFNFEMLFSHITTGIEVNRKGKDSYSLEPPKFIIPTNHALKGNSDSFTRRQYIISFSDYYNNNRRVDQDFGHQFFHEWEYDQWNLFYNWIALCIQQYLKYRLDYGIDLHDVNRRKLRQLMGENFLDWAETMYGNEGAFLNKRVEKTYARNHYLDKNPRDAKFTSPTAFKRKIVAYAEYAGLHFNPTSTDKYKRLKSGSTEYYQLTNSQFDPVKDDGKIHSDFDLKTKNAFL